MLGCLSLYCFMVFGPPGVALSAPLPGAVVPAAPSIQAYGRANKCESWTDGCTVCTRTAAAGSACSTPGIACTPTVIACATPVPAP